MRLNTWDSAVQNVIAQKSVFGANRVASSVIATTTSLETPCAGTAQYLLICIVICCKAFAYCNFFSSLIGCFFGK